jgi:RimJ/RimL family protein N-acetyltransferase
MRFKDFGEPEIVKLLSKDVLVSTTTPKDSLEIKILDRDNKDFLEPWRVPVNTDSSETKIFTIKHKNVTVGQSIVWNFQTYKNSLKSCSISYWLAEDSTGKGIGPEAISLICRYLFSELGVQEIDATIQPENGPSIKLIEKLGYEYKKTVGEHQVFQGRWQGYVVYTITDKLREPENV